MTDLRRVVTEQSELSRLYSELAAIGAHAEGRAEPWSFGAPEPEELLVLAAQSARHDPRLLWVVVDLLARGFDRFDALKLRRAAARARWPATIAVALEFARLANPSVELSDYAAFVTRRLPRARNERFFLGTRAFAGELSRRDVEESLREYTRWGYFSREVPIPKELDAAARGTLDRPGRLNVLRRLAERMPAVTVADYLEALAGRASRRQASRDLATAPFLERQGSKRGTSYRLASQLRAPAPGAARRRGTRGGGTRASRSRARPRA
jgi:hypothetical protein